MFPQTKSVGVKIIVVIYIALLLLDVISTLLNGPLVKHLETNPLYKYFGVAGIVVLNLGLLLIFYYAYKFGGPTTRFTILLLLCVICLVRMVVVWNNFMVFLNPPTLVQAASVTTAQKVSTIKRFAWSGLLMYLPGIITYFLFKSDHEIGVRNE